MSPAKPSTAKAQAGENIGRFLLSHWPEEVAYPGGDRLAIFVNTNFPDKVGEALSRGVESLRLGSHASIYLIGTTLSLEKMVSPRYDIPGLLEELRRRKGEVHVFDICLTCKGLPTEGGFSTRDLFHVLRNSDRLEVID